MERGTDLVKRGLAEMLKGGVIMDVTNADQARVAERPVRWPSWLSSASRPTSGDGGIARMSQPAR
jgi:pyridoxal 5'-phosphate synthase pdxS subunit